MALSKRDRRLKIKRRIRKRIFGTSEKPRLSVFRSNKHISAQIVDDINGKTLISATSGIKDISEKSGVTKSHKAELVGKLIAEKAVQAGISTVTFDRNGYLYHGRVKSLAEAARTGGLKF